VNLTKINMVKRQYSRP